MTRKMVVGQQILQAIAEISTNPDKEDMDGWVTVGDMAQAVPDWRASQVRTSLDYLASKGELTKTKGSFPGGFVVAYRLATDADRSDITSEQLAVFQRGTDRLCTSPALAMQLAIQSALCAPPRRHLPIDWARSSLSSAAAC